MRRICAEHILLLIVCLFPVQVFGEEKFTVTGVVRDGSTNEPLVFANVALQGTQIGTSTDDKGKFSLQLTQGEYSLRCSYVGYTAKKISLSVTKDLQIVVRLFATDVLLQDVTVYAYQGNNPEELETNALSLQSEKMKTSTTMVPDVLRAIQLLPGVSANNEFNAKFNVRGGNQDENLILVNGTQVYDPYHIKEVPNASISIFNMDMVNKMDIMTGGFPARYGDKMSSVVNIEYREGNRDHYSGSASLSITDLDVLAEGPLGENGSFIFGGRKSYLEYIIKLLGGENNVHPGFYDFQGVLGYTFTPGQKLLLKIIHAGDDYTEDPSIERYGPFQWTRSGSSTVYWEESSDSNYNVAHYYSTMIALQNIVFLSASALLKTEVSFYDQRENEWFWGNSNYYWRGDNARYHYFYTSWYQQIYRNALDIGTLEVNSSLDAQISQLYAIKTGISYQSITYNQDILFQATIDELTNDKIFPDTTRNHTVQNPIDEINNTMNTRSFKMSAYLENSVQLTDQLLLNIGGRMDYFDLNKDATFSPRINLAYYAGAGVTLRSGWGYFYQSPNYRQIAYPVASDTNTQSQKAIHYTLGADVDIPIDLETQKFFKIKVDGFYKMYDKLVTPIQTSYGLLYYTRKNDATGNAKGVDVYLSYSSEQLYAWLSYGLLFSEQETIGSSGGPFPRNTDQRHTLACVCDVDLGSRWNINTRFVYGSGYPYTPNIAVYNDTTKNWKWVSGKMNSEYLPFYARVDLRIAKGFGLFGTSAYVFLDISNLLNAANIQAYQYRFDQNGNPVKKGVELWPRIPSIGMSVKF